MEFPPTDWDIFQNEDFDLAVPRDPGELGLELAAQVRPNGRIQDHFRFTLGGTKMVEKVLPVSSIIPKLGLPAWQIRLAMWPRDISIRQNMATSTWVDLRDLVAAGEAAVTLEEEEVQSGTFADGLDAGTSTGKGKTSGSVRWAIGIGDDLHLRLLLQGLPGPAKLINSKPGLRG